MWHALVKGLAQNGHRVTVVTTFPSPKMQQGVQEIVVPNEDIVAFLDDYYSLRNSAERGIWNSLDKLAQGGRILLEVIFGENIERHVIIS